MVIREIYLERLRPFYDSEMVKVITGIRRCGKSTIMRQIVDELLERGITEEHIIYINFELCIVHYFIFLPRKSLCS